jgi:hypothetical protein
MKNNHVYNCIIVSENTRKEGNFKKFIKRSSYFTIIQEMHPSEILSPKAELFPIDHIFFSDKLSETLLGEIKTAIKSNNRIDIKPKITLYSAEEHIPRKDLIRWLIAGANAFMVAPHTLLSLSEACDFNQQLPPDEASKTRLKIAVRLMIQDSVDNSETPSMVHKVSDETKAYFKELGEANLSTNLIQFLSGLTHYRRISSYEHVHSKVSKLIRDRIKSHLGIGT